jgi:hypothetical protein
MLETRINIIAGASWYIMKALTIGVRYAVVRRQFSSIDG